MSPTAALASTTADDRPSVEQLLSAAVQVLRTGYEQVREGQITLSEDDLLEQTALAQQVQNVAWAIQSHRMAQYAAIEHRDEPHPDNPGRLVSRDVRHTPGTFVDEWAELELGARLGWSDRQTGSRLTQACDAVASCPAVLDRAGTGGLDARKVDAVAAITSGAPDVVAQQIEAAVLAGDPEASTSTKLRAKARRLLSRLDPVAADAASQERRRARVGVFVHPHHEPGLSELSAVLPTLDAAKLMAAIDAHARELHQVSTTGKTLAQSRVDALTDLALNGAVIDTQLVFMVPVAVTDPAATDDHPTDAGEPAASSSGSTPPGRSIAPRPPTPRVKRSNAPRAATAPPGWDPREWASYLAQERDWLDEEIDELIAFEGAQAGSEELGDSVDPSSGPADPAPAGPPGEAATSGAVALAPPPTRVRFVDPATRPPVISDVLVPRLGVIPGTAVEELTRVLGVKLSRALTDAATGVVTETATDSYRPGSLLARFVRTRDQHCRFPGCTHPARRCDIDHVIRHPDGETAAHNLQCLCRHHHRAKHEGGWRVIMTRDGVCTWTSPGGRRYVTHPAD